MDVMRLIDRLEALVSSGTRIPMTSRFIVDEQEFLDLVDQIRVAFPEELRQARKLSQERERLLSQAQVEADKILSSAREQASALVSSNEVVISAKREAEELLAQAKERAAEVRNDADTYAVEVLTRLEGELQRLLAQARKGRALLEKSGHEGFGPESSAVGFRSSGDGIEKVSEAGPAPREGTAPRQSKRGDG